MPPDEDSTDHIPSSQVLRDELTIVRRRKLLLQQLLKVAQQKEHADQLNRELQNREVDRD